MLKLSAYNHFQPWQNGNYLAFNALSGAVGLMTEENYSTYLGLRVKLRGGSEEFTPAERDLLKQLQYGRFVCDNDHDEFEALKFGHYRERYQGKELGLVIAPTMACNMACTYCFEGNKKGRMAPAVVESIVAFVEKKAPELTNLDINWYGGEPLLGMDIITDLTETIFDLAREHKFLYASSMITNGYLLNKENVDRLADLKVTVAQVSIDGPARIHNQKRPLKNGGDSFETILQNLQYAVTRMGVIVRVNIDKSFTRETVAELLQELDQAGLRQKVGVYFGLLEPATRVCAGIADSCYETPDFSGIEIEYYQLLLERGFKVEKLPSPVFIFCMAQHINGFLLDPEGEIYRCFNYVGDKDKSIGNVRDEINYNHPNFRHLFRFDPFQDDACRRCLVLPICMGSCPGRRADRVLEQHQYCESWKFNLGPMLEIIALSRQQQMPSAAKEPA